ncbi:MAG TPA: acyl-CoA dehydrogenase family protein, partial [Gemmatimonadaceae bacterium]|nr:acyl-CoA dehydrogenase family protein [Gemmatimonadaceae bacterium]
DTFAMDAISRLTVTAAERGHYDIRLEAAIAKMYNTEKCWRIVDDALQIRGGRGYETADSLRDRGERPVPVERFMRDARINLIFEGSSEIMRLFIAREAVDKHFKLAFPIVSPDSTFGQRVSAAVRAAPFYLTWYPALWWPRVGGYGRFGPLARHVRFAARHARKLGRTLFHAMVRYGPSLERRQAVLFRGVDIGAELFAMTAACVYADAERRNGNAGAIELADVFCREAEVRVRELFRNFNSRNDGPKRRLAGGLLDGDYAWMEEGIISAWGADSP